MGDLAGKRFVDFVEGWALATVGERAHWMRFEGHRTVSLCRNVGQSKYFALFEPGKAMRCKHCMRIKGIR